MPARRKIWISALSRRQAGIHCARIATSEVARQRPRLLRGEIFLFCFLVATAIFLFSSRVVFAAMSLTFSNAPSSVLEEEPFEIDVSLVDAPATRNYYLRAAFYEEGKTQYFGYTYNHEGNWHNSPSEHKKFLQITTSQEGSWSGKLKTKADLQATAFKGAGNYKFKIGRYTEGGSGPTWSDNTATITINIQSTPTPSPSPSPTPTLSPSPIPTPSPTPSPSPSPSPKAVEVTATFAGEILGEESSPRGIYLLESPSPSPEVLGEKTQKSQFLPKVFLISGLVFLFAGAFSLWYNFGRNEES